MTDPLMPTYGRMDVAFVKGEGAWLVDDKGNRYLDALSGLGVVALGHAHPAVTATLARQGSLLVHTSNLYRIPAQEKLAAQLAAISGMDNMFFGNSGAEANECAIKLARLYGKQRGVDVPTIIVTDASFHGRTLATLTATGSRKVQAGFEPLVHGFVRAPFDDIPALKQIGKHNNSIVAVMVEPIQGEGGIRIPDPNYLAALRQLCDEREWLLILDEVQSGNGRTGKYFGYQHAAILPDIVTTAKGLANGLPIGVCMARGIAATLFKPGNHGSTFGGNPLVSAVASTVVTEITDNRLAERAGVLGDRMLARFRARLGGLNNVKDIRGQGLMLAQPSQLDPDFA